MNPYPSYKERKVEWIGEIPIHWDLTPVKYLFNERNEKNVHGDTNYLSIVKDIGVVLYSEKGNVGNKTSDNPDNYKKVYIGDIVINPMNIIIGSVGISRYNGCLSSVYIVIEPKNIILSSYYDYIFSNKIFQKSLLKICYGIMELRESLNKIEFFTEKLPCPTLQEQQQISNYLDQKTKQIDDLIEKTEQKIRLVKEKRKSLINHCVTKGLDLNVEMKDSGVEWIGEIPSGWRMVPLRFLGEFQNGISKGSEYFGSGFPFMNYGDVYKNDITPKTVEGKVHSDEVERNRYSVLRGDVFFTRTSESTDDIGVSSVCLGTIDESVFSGFVIRFRFIDNSHVPEYSRYHFQTHWKKVLIESKMNIVTRSSLSQQVLGQLPVLIPPLPEQQQIVTHLDKETQKIDTLTEKENKRIDLLKEYRQSLISEVVTGKVDVRDEVLR
jgi:type I restriction enzyme, S subunit